MLALDKLLPSLTEAGREFPGRLPSSLSLSLVTWDRALLVVAVEALLDGYLSARPDVLAVFVYTFARNIVLVVRCVVPGFVVVTLGTYSDIQALKSIFISDWMII